jgi:hypothetical protein
LLNDRRNVNLFSKHKHFLLHYQCHITPEGLTPRRQLGETQASRVPASLVIMGEGGGEERRGGAGEGSGFARKGGKGIVMTDEDYVAAALGLCRKKQQQQQQQQQLQRQATRNNLSGTKRFAPAFAGT